MVRALALGVPPLFTLDSESRVSSAIVFASEAAATSACTQLRFDLFQLLLRIAQLALQRQRTLDPWLAAGHSYVMETLARRSEKNACGFSSASVRAISASGVT